MTATWSVSPSTKVSPNSGSGTSATFSGTCGNIGDATVTFAINASGSTVYESKEFNVIGPDPLDLEFDMYYSTGGQAPKSGSTFLQCPNTNYHIYLVNNSGCAISSYIWTIPSGWTKNYQSSHMISINTNSSPGGQVIVGGQTCCSSCGSASSLRTGYFGVYYSCGGGYYMASPNPVDGFVEINETQATSALKSSTVNTSIQVLVYNTMGSIVHSLEVSELPYKINTSELPAGNYIVRIIDGGIVENLNIIVRR